VRLKGDFLGAISTIPKIRILSKYCGYSRNVDVLGIYLHMIFMDPI
jgi:hypothetical protein